MPKILTCSTLLALTLSTPSFASGGGLWAGLAATVCLEQDAGNKNTSIGKILVNDPGYQKWRKTQSAEVLQCIASKNLLSSSLCSELMNQDEKAGSEVTSKMYEKYSTEIQGLDRVKECSGEK